MAQISVPSLRKLAVGVLVALCLPAKLAAQPRWMEVPDAAPVQPFFKPYSPQVEPGISGASPAWQPIPESGDRLDIPVVWSRIPARAGRSAAPGPVSFTPLAEVADPPEWRILEPANLPIGEAEAKAVVWEVIPGAEASPSVQWQAVSPHEADSLHLRTVAAAGPAEPVPPPPRLLAFNRSIAFSNGSVGPDISWRVPTGFQWTPHHWLDATVHGFSRRASGQSFASWNGGDAVANVFVNLINSGDWSFGLSQSIRSVDPVNDGPDGDGTIGTGQSTGFRLARSLGPNAGIAFGGEQIIQWDSQTDTGRTFYLAFSKGWWLGAGAEPFPLLVGSAALATGRLASDPDVSFWCVNTGENRSGNFAIDNELCWSPVASLALVIDSQLSVFTEYNSVRWLLGASIAPIPDLPLRATLAVNLADQIQTRGFQVDPDTMTWSFRLSLGF